MAIIFDQKAKSFHLKTKHTSYMMGIYKDGYLAHLYYGRRMEVNRVELRFEERAHIMNDNPDDRAFSPETMPQEYPAFGAGDLKNPAYQNRDAKGHYISDARYISHRIYKGKEPLKGLPSTFVLEGDRAETLEIVLKDEVINLSLVLSYTVFEDYDIITRSVRLINTGEDSLHVLKAASMSVDFTGHNFDLIHLTGSWARECMVERTPLVKGRIELDSARGVSSSQHNPFFALAEKDATEDYGEVYGFSLVYSGNHLIQAETDQYQMVRACMGINPQNFDWKLEAGEEFQTPECVMAYSCEGISLMSRLYHRIYRERLCRSKFAGRPRPVLINSWEAFFFDFTEASLAELAEESRNLGIDLLVLDDGWFGKRNNARSSLGDWHVNKDKLPSGIDGLAKRINGLGMKFGIWVEPEMISPDSELFRVHPDWRLHVPGRAGHQSRNQYVLDLSRKGVCDWLVEAVSGILQGGNVAYVKWDMNRQLSEVASPALPPDRQGEIYHRYVLGLYDCMGRLTARFPDVLFEGCEGGGGRFDPGILHYMPQIWASDDTDGIERLAIQYGYSFVYPWSSISAHYSAVPNHQVGRITPAKTRACAAMTGSFGYELNIGELPEKEKAEIKEINRAYKEDQKLLATGEFYRLLSPESHDRAAWMIAASDGSQAVVYYFGILNHPNQPFRWLKLKGLEADAEYFVKEMGRSYAGAELMYIGLPMPNLKKDFQAESYHLVRCGKQ
ncbi:alpha-galactosidase [Hungatella hathewayi]|uniref:alpha-galactosidase n=1 Tax=Hungatella hathewayi TaxID=154046 RepID=UPI00356562BE